MSPGDSAQARPVRLLAAGGTISMQGEHAVPTLDAAGLVAAIPELGRFSGADRRERPRAAGPQITLEQGLPLVRQAVQAAAGGDGVVITTGTDTLEELAMLCALQHDGEAPIVFTGANRPASAPAPTGRRTCWTPWPSPAGRRLRAGHRRGVRRRDPCGHDRPQGRQHRTSAFAAPVAGPIGRVVEGRVWLHARPSAVPTLAPRRSAPRCRS